MHASKGSIKLYDQKSWITSVKGFIFCNETLLKKWNFTEVDLQQPNNTSTFI